MTDFIPPMTPRLSQSPPNGADWLHEIKFDGFRLQAHVTGKGEARTVTLYSRNGADFTKRFRPLVSCVSALPVSSAILDGEVVACGVGGRPDFPSLLSKGGKAEGICFVGFDLLALNGKPLLDDPIEKRRAKLQALIAKAKEPRVQFSESFDNAEALLVAAETAGLEGIVSKRLGSPYRSGPARTWVKVKTKAWREANRERYKLFER